MIALNPVSVSSFEFRGVLQARQPIIDIGPTDVVQDVFRQRFQHAAAAPHTPLVRPVFNLPLHFGIKLRKP